VKTPSGVGHAVLHHVDHTFFAQIASCHATNSLFMVLKEGPTILASASFTLEKASMLSRAFSDSFVHSVFPAKIRGALAVV
jgi:hypothetical protein